MLYWFSAVSQAVPQGGTCGEAPVRANQGMCQDRAAAAASGPLSRAVTQGSPRRGGLLGKEQGGRESRRLSPGWAESGAHSGVTKVTKSKRGEEGVWLSARTKRGCQDTVRMASSTAG